MHPTPDLFYHPRLRMESQQFWCVRDERAQAGNGLRPIGINDAVLCAARRLACGYSLIE
jgi:hypothetical protein